MLLSEEIVSHFKKLWPAIPRRLVIMGMAGLLLLLVGQRLEAPAAQPAPLTAVSEAAPDYAALLEARLASSLSKVAGAGAVHVIITLEQSSRQEHAKNITKENRITQEKDSGGVSRTITESKDSEQILLGRENGLDRPVVVSEIKPVIKGVLITAEGAYDSTIKASLTRAAATGLGLPAYKITVLPQQK